MYSIAAILHPREDKNGLHKIQIRIIYQRKKSYLKTKFKVKQSQFDVQVVNHPNAEVYNRSIKEEIEKIEKRLIVSGFQDVKGLVKKVEAEAPKVVKYIESVIELKSGKLAKGTLDHMTAVSNKLSESLEFSDINIKWLEHFEANLRKKKDGKTLDGNTVHANMKRLKSLLKLARKDGLIAREQYEDYQVPKYEQKLVEYLTEAEIESFQNLTFSLGESGMKRAGYYFLLSCYTGYRISDAKRFDFEQMVHGDKIVLRTSKNKEVVSIPIHSRLQVILDYIKVTPLDLSEHHIREYVKEICKLSGIKKHIKYHSSRHAFAMLLMAKGFTIDEVAELIGDSELITKVYAKVHNESLGKKIRERLG